MPVDCRLAPRERPELPPNCRLRKAIPGRMSTLGPKATSGRDSGIASLAACERAAISRGRRGRSAVRISIEFSVVRERSRLEQDHAQIGDAEDRRRPRGGERERRVRKDRDEEADGTPEEQLNSFRTTVDQIPSTRFAPSSASTLSCGSSTASGCSKECGLVPPSPAVPAYSPSTGNQGGGREGEHVSAGSQAPTHPGHALAVSCARSAPMYSKSRPRVRRSSSFARLPPRKSSPTRTGTPGSRRWRCCATGRARRSGRSSTGSSTARHRSTASTCLRIVVPVLRAC